MGNPLVSIILINYNGLVDLEECVNSIFNLNYDNFEVILVDNNSSDDSVQFVKQNYPNIQIIQLRKNYGFTKANNIGASKSKGRYILLLNIDTYVDKNWLKELVKAAQESRKVGVVGSKIYYYNEKEIIDFAGGSSNIYGRASHIGMSYKDCEFLNKKKKTFYICGASLLIKREAYNIIGLFDPKYFGYYDDVDLCWRTWMAGYKVIYAPKSFLYHKISSSFKSTERKKYLSEKNRLRTILRNYELKTLFKILPGYFSEIINEILAYRHYNPLYYKKHVKMYLKLLFWNLSHIFSLIRYRFKIQRIRRKDDKFIFSVMKNT